MGFDPVDIPKLANEAAVTISAAVRQLRVIRSIVMSDGFGSRFGGATVTIAPHFTSWTSPATPSSTNTARPSRPSMIT